MFACNRFITLSIQSHLFIGSIEIMHNLNKGRRIAMLSALLIFANIAILLGQEPHNHEGSESHRKHRNKCRLAPDSTAQSRFNQKADQVLTSVFKPDREFIADSLIKVFDDSPSFGIFKDNYVVVGTELFNNPDRNNSDAKFQISFSQRLTNSILPFKTYLFLTYTQLAFWDVFKESFPFRDINFNPTVGLAKPLVYKNRYLGEIAFQLEHESNGKDGDASRSWNKASFYGQFKINPHWSYFTKLWLPIVDGENNRNIVRFRGWSTTAISYNQKEKYNASLIINKRGGNVLNANITANFAYRLFHDENQYLFFEFYNGYGEGLLDYNQFHRRFRIGFVIKPSFRFIY